MGVPVAREEASDDWKQDALFLIDVVGQGSDCRAAKVLKVLAGLGDIPLTHVPNPQIQNPALAPTGFNFDFRFYLFSLRRTVQRDLLVDLLIGVKKGRLFCHSVPKFSGVLFPAFRTFVPNADRLRGVT